MTTKRTHVRAHRRDIVDGVEFSFSVAKRLAAAAAFRRSFSSRNHVFAVDLSARRYARVCEKIPRRFLRLLNARDAHIIDMLAF